MINLRSVEMATVVPLADVERELNQRLKLLQGPGEAPVQLTRMANLVIFTTSPGRAALIEAQLPEIVAVHPARVLLLTGELGPNDKPLETAVRVRPIQVGRRQAFCEQVNLSAGGPSVDRLPFAVRALLIGDLPTNLWWAASMPPPLAGALLFDLAEQAEQIMYDSLGWPDPARGVAATAGWLEQVERPASGGWRVASDLNWRWLKYWRRLAAQALDPASAPGAAETVTELYAEHGPHGVVQAWELVSWLTLRLGWTVKGSKVNPGTEMVWYCTTAHGDARVCIHRLEEGPPALRRLRIVCKLNDKPAAMNLVAERSHRLAIQLEGVEGEPRTITLPPLTPAEVVGRQLSDRERDPVFLASMKVAQVMAQSVLG